jgi:Fe-S-cluster containining protein
MKVWEFLHFIHPCPFLKDGSCIVYPVRPMACRIYLSCDSESCRAQYDSPEDSRIMARLYEFPLRAGRLFNEGIRHALAEKGIITSEWLIETFLCQVFDDPDILARWIDDYKSIRIREMSREEQLYMKSYQENPGSA